MDIIYSNPALLLALPIIPPAAYSGLYLVLRVFGKLSVNQEGWQAGCISLGRPVVVTALRLFTVFEPLLEWESNLHRRLAGSAKKKDDPISDVVVEVVRMA